MRTRVTEMLGIRLPIVQGGLARVAGAELCAAVSEAAASARSAPSASPTPKRCAGRSAAAAPAPRAPSA
jgi:NAD(P)H-dependent flavin oxidoreductase YrpB (nitropropane dioxygenase family)